MSEEQKPTKTWLEKLGAAFSGEPKDRDELVELLHDAVDKGLLNVELLAMIEGVMHVSEMQVRDIMIPRAQMSVIQANSPLEDIIPVIIDSGHSRFPVVGETRDKITGILLAKDILQFYYHEQTERFDINNIIRPATFVPESKRLDSLLREFRRNHNHLAIVADEYGGIAGLITIEDVLEQIVGNIEDEYDLEEEEEFIRQHTETEYTINALTSIDDFNDYFDETFSDKEFDTVGGLVIHEFGHMPKRDETTTIGQYEFTVLNADSRRVRLLRLTMKK